MDIRAATRDWITSQGTGRGPCTEAKQASLSPQPLIACSSSSRARPDESSLIHNGVSVDSIAMRVFVLATILSRVLGYSV